MFFQLFDSNSNTYSYLLGCGATREAVIIDPVTECHERDLTLIEELELKLRYIVDTHVHADHITGAYKLRAGTGANIVVSAEAKVDLADIRVKDGQELPFGRQSLRVLSTPGHTAGCTSYVWDDKVFTGDALLIRGTGRTDFQEGSAPALYRSITQKLFALPDATLVYPAHDYKGHTHSTIGLEKKYNPRVGGGRSEAEFVKIMSELKLDPPKKLAEALPANLRCGRV